MLKSLRRRNSYPRNSRYRQPKHQKNFSLLWIAAAVPLSLIVLEVLARLLLGVTGKGVVGEAPIVQAYRLKFLTETQKPIEGLANSGSLAAKRSPAVSYQLVEKQKNKFWQINEQGFRDNDPVPLAKPSGEIRIFVLGGSTAFGQASQNNDTTISHTLETLLKQRVADQQRSPEKYRPDVFPFFVPDRLKLMELPPKIKEGKYRVINAAIPGYTSGNELAQLALEILPYQPDLIIVLNGYSDLMLPSNKEQSEIPKIDYFLQDATGHFQTALGQSWEQWISNTALLRAINIFILKSQDGGNQRGFDVISDGKSLEQSLPKDEAELKRRLQRYQDNQKQMLRFAAAVGSPILFAMQPEITGRSSNNLSSQEKKVLDKLDRNYQEKLPKEYQQFIQATKQLNNQFPEQVKSLNLYQLNYKPNDPLFSDPIHLTETANKIIAEKLYDTIINWEKNQIIPENFYLDKGS
jgi:lysophospholipase L1-like esterase